MNFNLRYCSLETVRALCEQYNGYEGAGGAAVYAFAVYERERAVAGYAWQPPPPGAARSVCIEAPAGVLSLSRMVAVPREERALNHVSRPLKRQMHWLIDRSRWPVLVTYSDEGEGHTGHVYKCSGWRKTLRSERPVFEDATGKRTSSYSNGKHATEGLRRVGSTIIQRWEHWICPREIVAALFALNWTKTPVLGKVWRSGAQAFTYTRKVA